MSLSMATRGYLSDPGTGGGTGVAVVSMVGAARQVTITFNVACGLTPSGANVGYWAIAGGSVQILRAANSPPNSIVLTTSEQLTGGVYTLMIPAGAVVDLSGNANPTDIIHTFTGVGQAPTVVSVTPTANNTFIVRYSQPMNVASVTTKSHYTFTPALAINDILMQTESSVRVYTEPRLPTTYSLVVTGVVDIVGNPI